MTWIGQVPFEDIGMTEGTMDLLKELAEDSNYWNRAYQFVQSTTNRKLYSLSYSQRQWLTTIILDLNEELLGRSWKI